MKFLKKTRPATPCPTCTAIAALLKKAQAGTPQARISKPALHSEAKPKN